MSCVDRVPTKRGPKGGTKFIRQVFQNGTINNTYIAGSGVGASTISIRNVKKRFATAKIKAVVDAIITSIISAVIGGTEQLLVYNFEAIENTPAAAEIVNQVITSSLTNTRIVIYSSQPFDIEPLVTNSGYSYINSVDIIPNLSNPIISNAFIITENEISLSGSVFYTKTIDFEEIEE
jgi:hypothetical protein